LPTLLERDVEGCDFAELFHCVPCREIIQFFDVGADGDAMRYVKLSRGVTHPGKNMHAA
jgi:hypothetical protein